MSNHTPPDLDLPPRRVVNETKPATRNTEFVAYVLAVAGVWLRPGSSTASTPRVDGHSSAS